MTRWSKKVFPEPLEPCSTNDLRAAKRSLSSPTSFSRRKTNSLSSIAPAAAGGHSCLTLMPSHPAYAESLLSSVPGRLVQRENGRASERNEGYFPDYKRRRLAQALEP